MRRLAAVLSLLTLTLTACHQAPTAAAQPSPIVGVWLVTTPEAPFPLHMFAFHADGTVQQSNPDAGNATTSDSSAMGVWVPDGDHVKGKIVEITADRATHQFVSRGEISFSILPRGDTFAGTATAVFYGADGKPARAPIAATLSGQRVRP